MPEPHMLFTLWRADEVAECLEGVTPELYQRLWQDIVSIQELIPNIEDNGPHDVIGIGCLAKYWDKLTMGEQVQLNHLAKKQDEKYWGD
jgi:hypothetical protein